MKFKISILIVLILLLFITCTEGPEETDEGFLSEEYPGDVGMENDSSVIWMENFEEDSITEMLSKYEDCKKRGGMYFDINTPALSSGSHSLALVAGGNRKEKEPHPVIEGGRKSYY